MGCGDFGFGFGAGGQQSGAHIVEADVALEELARHLRLTGQTAEIDDSAGLGDCFGANAGGKVSTVDGGNCADVIVRRIGLCRRSGVGAKSLASSKSFRARVGCRIGSR
jgi:hypothetical protein